MLNMKIEKYVRRPFPVDCVEVTASNLQEVALWSGGKLLVTKEGHENGAGLPYVKIQTRNVVKDKQTMAFPGDWVLKMGTSFRVYTEKTFHQNFVATISASLAE